MAIEMNAVKDKNKESMGFSNENAGREIVLISMASNDANGPR